MLTPIVFTAAVVVVMLGVGAALTDPGRWYDELRKPTWNPPKWLFGPAWTVILGLAAWAAVICWSNSATVAARTLTLGAFGVNAVLHVLWSPLFFKFRRPDWALVEICFLWLSIVALVCIAGTHSTTAVLALCPYLLWVSFAAYLNLTIVRLNSPFLARR